MRNPVAFLLSTLIGIAFGVPGLSALVFVGLFAWRPGLALTWAQWVAAHTPITLESFLELRPNGVFLVRSQWGTFGAGALLSLLGYFALHGARESLRPADQSSGGLAQVLIKTQCPCVGAVLEGELKLLTAPKPDQVFRVSLLCRHIHSLADDRRERTVVCLSQDIEIKITQVVEGWQLPFRFEVPADAPPSTVFDNLGYLVSGPPMDEYSWFIEFFPTDKWIVSPSSFKIVLGAAPV